MMKNLKTLLTDYKVNSEQLQQSLQSILDAPPKFLDVDKLKSKKELLDFKINNNIQRIEKKQIESSQSIGLDSIKNVLEAIKTLIDSTNILVGKHNKMALNLDQEKMELTAEVWKYLFEKEIKEDLAAYNSKRRGDALNEETFWTVRKFNQFSKLQHHDSNPVKTLYELLWNDVKDVDRSNLSIQNTLRRILENYFKILGNVDPDEICGYFEGKEKLICRALFSWVNDGSHSAHDDLFVSTNDSTVDGYLEVFKRIFVRSGHEAHYKMMLGEPYCESPTTKEAARS